MYGLATYTEPPAGKPEEGAFLSCLGKTFVELSLTFCVRTGPEGLIHWQMANKRAQHILRAIKLLKIEA